MAEKPLDLNRLAAEYLSSIDWVTEHDLRSRAQEEPASVTVRGPGTLLFNTRAYRLAGDAAQQNGLASAPRPTWFKVGHVRVENTHLLIIQPVEPNTPGALEGVLTEHRPFVLAGLHDFFRRHGIDLTSREGRHCRVEAVQNLGGQGYGLVVNYTEGVPFAWSETQEDEAAAGGAPEQAG